MRASIAYFVGAATIVVAIGIGLGGGIVAGNIMNPTSPKQGPDAGKPDTSKVARSAQPAAAPNAASEGVQYLAGSQTFGAVLASPAQAEATRPNTEPSAAQPAPQTAAAAEPKPEAGADAKPEAKPANAPGAQQASTEPASSTENAYAKAKDVDVKRAASERRHAERRRRWAERRRYYEPRDPRQSRGYTDWDDVARNVREDSDARNLAASRRGSFPQMRLFSPDDD